MFIKYDEIELIEFFESEPIFIGDEEAAGDTEDPEEVWCKPYIRMSANSDPASCILWFVPCYPEYSCLCRRYEG